LAALGVHLALYNDSPDYQPLATEIDAWLLRLPPSLNPQLIINTQNLGFVKTMNHAVSSAVSARQNLLLLNSDTMLEPGAVREMARVLASDPTIGFVNPRSNNATITTLPIGEKFSNLPRAQKRAVFKTLADLLPPISYAPTSVGFCLLIRWEIIAEFGGFDEIYGAGYNEENDLVMRASRCGWRAVMANHAFVWHEGEASFSTSNIDRNAWEATNRAILDTRYPEYAVQTGNFFDQPETVAERVLSALIPDENGKLDFAFDFSSFRPAHNGTFMAGLQLLQAASGLADRFNVHVICAEDVYQFHNYADLNIPRSDPHATKSFAAVFRVGQPYDWNVMQRLAMTSSIIGVYMLDTISIDCPQLSSPRLYNLWDFTLRHIDFVAAQSQQTAQLLENRFSIPASCGRLVSMHSLDLSQYALPTSRTRPRQSTSILVTGNHYHHKYLSPTVNALAEAFPDRQIVSMGLSKPTKKHVQNPEDPVPLKDLTNIVGMNVGLLGESDIGDAYTRASCVVFPSMAEGFGFPVLDTLAMKRPIFLRRLPVFLELWKKLGRTPNMHFYDTTAELIEILQTPPIFIENSEPVLPQDGAARSVREIRDAAAAALTRVDAMRVISRVRDMQFASDVWYRPDAPALPEDPASRAARRLAGIAESVGLMIFRNRIIYSTGRAIGRALMRLRYGKRTKT